VLACEIARELAAILMEAAKRIEQLLAPTPRYRWRRLMPFTH
jgi:hypothetical protein